MSELKMKTIESLPLIEEPSENATIMGLKEGRAVQIPVGAVGGGTTGVVFTYEWDENAGSAAPVSIEPMDGYSAYVTSCSHSFDECCELIPAGSPVVFVDKDSGIVSSTMNAEFGVNSGGIESLAPFSVESAPDGAYIHISFMTWNGYFYIDYTADYLNGWYDSGSES